jgi:hypothetical protein
MKRTAIITIILCLLDPFILQAASGYYIKLNGDTVRGVFGSIPDNSNPGIVQFTPSNANEAVVLRPQDIRSFRSGSYDNFLAYNGMRTLSADGGNTLDTLHTFLRQIGETNGYSFYTFSDNRGLTLFYSGTEGKASELKRHEAVNSEVDDYHGQLKSILSSKVDSSDLSTLLHRLDYTEEGLISFIDDINDLTSVHAGIPAVNGFILTAGVNYNFFTVSGTDGVPMVVTDYDNSFSWLIGFGYMKPLKKGGGRYFVYPNIQAFSYEATGEVKREDAAIRTTFKSDFTIFPQLNIGCNIIHKPGIKIYASAGFGALVLFDNKEVYEINYFDGEKFSDTSTETDAAFDINITAGGFLFNRYMLFVAYSIPAASSNHQYYTGYLSGIQAGLGLRF